MRRTRSENSRWGWSRRIRGRCFHMVRMQLPGAEIAGRTRRTASDAICHAASLVGPVTLDAGVARASRMIGIDPQDAVDYRRPTHLLIDLCARVGYLVIVRTGTMAALPGVATVVAVHRILWSAKTSCAFRAFQTCGKKKLAPAADLCSVGGGEASFGLFSGRAWARTGFSRAIARLATGTRSKWPKASAPRSRSVWCLISRTRARR